MIFTVRKGWHFSLPRLFRFWRKPTQITYAVTLLDNFAYEFPDWETSSSDQWDWLKLFGVSWRLFANKVNAALVGIRYNPGKGLAELVPYYHVKKATIYARDPVAQAQLKEQFFVQIQIDWQRKVYRYVFQIDGKRTIAPEQPFSHRNTLGRMVLFYFGGNRTAPQKIQVQLLPLKDLPPVNNT